MYRKLKDPLNCTVLFRDGFCHLLEDQVELLHDVCKVIESTIRKPAMIFQDQYRRKRYYYRAVNWHNTLLIEAQQVNGSMQAIVCVLDPSAELMCEIFNHSRLVFEKY